MTQAEDQEAAAPTPMPRWLRRVRALLVVILVLYVALVITRWWRDYPNPEERPVFRGAPAVLNFAHRGASAEAEENTLRAFELAIEQGADVLEVDVHISRDGKVVVSHDHNLGRIFGVEKRISELSYEQIVSAARGAKKAAPPLLGEVLDGYPSARLNIELKDNSKWLAAAVSDLLAEQGAQERVIVVSARCSALRKFRRFSKGRVATGACGSEAMRFGALYLLEVAARPKFDALQIPSRIDLGLVELDFGSRSFLDFAHKHGLQVHYWTIDEPAEMRRLINAGADGIMTNWPARLRGVLERDGAGQPSPAY